MEGREASYTFMDLKALSHATISCAAAVGAVHVIAVDDNAIIDFRGSLQGVPRRPLESLRC